MKSLAHALTALCVLVAAPIGFADDSTDRNPEALRGISSVVVKVSDKSRNSALPATALIQSQFEQLLQSRCELTIRPASETPGPEFHVDLLTVPVPQVAPPTALVLLRTSVWRPALPTLTGGTTADTSKSAFLMTAWVATTISDPKKDPLLTAAILNHISALESTLRAAGQIAVLPRAFSEVFFQSRKAEMEKKLVEIFEQNLVSPLIKPKIKVDMTLDKGILTYKFSGTITSTFPPVSFDIGAANPEGRLDLAALAEIKALPTAKICMKGTPAIPGSAQCATISDLFQ